MLATACAGEEKSGQARSADAATASSPVERCTERLLRRVRPEDAERAEARRYVRVTYCARFAERGWVYDDGTLSIAAHRWLEESGSEECASAAPGEPVETVPCEELEPAAGPRRIDCALLHHVRRSEVRSYLAQLRRERDVECDDGTPLAELGTPSAGTG